LTFGNSKVDITLATALVRRILLLAGVLAGLGLMAGNASAQRETRCWWDDEGNFKCGDRFDPDDARFDRTVINQQGIPIREEQGEITPEEQAEIERLRLEEEQRVRSIEESRRYDQLLLDVYLEVRDIEALRDRRLELLESRIRLLGISLGNARRKLVELEGSAMRFAPYSEREDASPIPENLAREIDQTESGIALREQMIEEISASQAQIAADFGRDIERFRELKGL
jgi:hypothetical protein